MAKLAFHFWGHWWPLRSLRSAMIMWEAKNSFNELVSLSPLFCYQTWLTWMAKLAFPFWGHWWPRRTWRSPVIMWEAKNSYVQLVSLSPSFWYQTWLICRAKTRSYYLRSLVTSEDLEVSWHFLGGWKCLVLISHIEPIIQSLWKLTPSMLHFLNLVSQRAKWAGHAKDLPGPLKQNLVCLNRWYS